MTAIPPWFAEACKRYPRIAIAGGPGTGKTTLAGMVTDRPVWCTDEVVSLPWEIMPTVIFEKARGLGPAWVIEGCQVARALRKGLASDAVVILTIPRRKISRGEIILGKGIQTILSGLRFRAPVIRP